MLRGNGYPLEYWEGRRRSLTRFSRVLAAVFALVCCFVYHAIYSDAPLPIAAGLGALFLYLLLVLDFSMRERPKLALYFESKVAGDWVWSAPLSRNCIFLDEICESLGVAALSSFGFTDEQSGKPMIWHAPESGVRTATALIDHLRANSGDWDEADAILADLGKMVDRLRIAETQAVQFCFILHEPSISYPEIEQRRGCF